MQIRTYQQPQIDRASARSLDDLSKVRLFFALHLILVIFYGLPIIADYPISFAAYVAGSYLIWNRLAAPTPVYRTTEIRRELVAARLVTIAGTAILLFYIDSLRLPNFFAVTLEEKLAANRILPRFVPAFFFIAALYTGASKRVSDKLLASLLLILLFFESQSTSRGGILLSAIPIYLIWREYASVKVAALAAVAGLVLFFIEIMYVRLGVDSLDLIELLYVERQGALLSGQVGDGLQDAKWKIFFFFLPAAIKGEWMASNYFVSEALLGVSSDNPLFFVITTGDFGVYRIGYGPMWPIYAAFGISVCLLMVRWLGHNLTNYKAYFVILFLIIGSRAGTESLLTVLFHGAVAPTLFVKLLAAALRMVKH